MKITENNAREFAQKIVDMFLSGIAETVMDTAKLVVEFIDSGQPAQDILQDVSGGLFNRHLVSRLERVGRSQLAWQMFYLTGGAYDKLGKMPPSVQMKYLNEPIQLLLVNGHGATDTLLVKISDLTPQQCQQVFDSDSIRDIPAQRAWLEDQKTQRAMGEKKPLAMPYKIKGRTVTFMQGATMTARELVLLLAEIDR